MIALLLGLAHAGCDLSAPPDAAFEVRAPPEADNVYVIIEVWADEASIDWAAEVLRVLEARDRRGTLVLPAQPPGPKLTAWLTANQLVGHDVAVRLTASQVPRDAITGPRSLRKKLRELRKTAGKVKATVAPIPNRMGEAIMGKAGFRAILVADGPSTSAARPAAVFEGQPRIGIVLPPGPYSGECGSSPLVPAFTPKAADRAAQAIHGAARAKGPGVVRVVLQRNAASDTDTAVLGRWLDEVVLASLARVTTPSAARMPLLQYIRSGVEKPGENATEGGRLLAVEDVKAAAEALREVRTIPRTLPGDIVPTEAFLALSRLLAGEVEGTVVRLSALTGPGVPADTALSGPTPFERQVVVDTAIALGAALPDEIPAALPVGGKLLSAGELLLLFASAARGDDPPTTRPVAVPEPNERGLGWGRSDVP